MSSYTTSKAQQMGEARDRDAVRLQQPSALLRPQQPSALRVDSLLVVTDEHPDEGAAQPQRRRPAGHQELLSESGHQGRRQAGAYEHV